VSCVCVLANSITWIEWSRNWRKPRTSWRRLKLLQLTVIHDCMLKKVIDLYATTVHVCVCLKNILRLCIFGPKRRYTNLLLLLLFNVFNFPHFTARRVCIARTMPWQDVRPSVCHTLVFCLNGYSLHILKVSSLSGSPTILVSSVRLISASSTGNKTLYLCH